MSIAATWLAKIAIIRKIHGDDSRYEKRLMEYYKDKVIIIIN